VRWGAPEPELCGLGGERLAAEGVRVVGDPVAKAAMGADVLRSLSFYRGLLTDAARALQAERVDACIPVDSPALHVPLGHIAKASGVPVVHYVTPQYWGWAPWRVAGYRRAVDLALTILPFEESWFRRHGVTSAYVGHPQEDVLAEVPAPATGSERTTLVLLPGSRSGVIRRNLPFLLRVAARLRADLPELEVVLPQERAEIGSELEILARESGVRVTAGTLHAELARARVALSVSGTILLDLLHHGVPSVAVYRIGGVGQRLLLPLEERVLTVPYFASVNLLAGREVVPEYRFDGEGPVEEVAATLLGWYKDPEERIRVQDALAAARTRLGPPGAAGRAAGLALRVAAGKNHGRPDPPLTP